LLKSHRYLSSVAGLPVLAGSSAYAMAEGFGWRD